MMTKAFALATSVVLASSLFASSAIASLIVRTFDEVNSPPASSGFPLPSVDVETETYSIPFGEVVLSATLEGTFGLTSQHVGSTAHHQLFIDGQLVADTQTFTPSPFFNIVPFSVSVPISVLADGIATLSYIQTSQTIVRLSETTLKIVTGPGTGVVPEASTLIVWSGLACCCGLVAKLRRTTL